MPILPSLTCKSVPAVPSARAGLVALMLGQALLAPTPWAIAATPSATEHSVTSTGPALLRQAGLPTAPVPIPSLPLTLLSQGDMRAIVQLQGLNLPPIQVQGSTTVALSPMGQTRVLTLPARFGNQPDSHTLMVDTGASTTLLSKALVTKLGLSGQPIPSEQSVSTAAGSNCPSMDAMLHRLPTLMIGQTIVRELRGLAYTHAELPSEVDGVLGMNFLSAFDLGIDPRQRILQLATPTPLPPEFQATAVPLKRRQGVMLTQVRINNQGPFTMLLDTGADSLFISRRVVAAAQLGQQPAQAVQVRGFCGLEDAQRIQLPPLTLGPHTVENLDAVVLTSSVIEQLQVDGVLGQSVLEQFSQYWRFPPQSQPEATGSLILIRQ
jgi:predicted aspartyl protease